MNAELIDGIKKTTEHVVEEQKSLSPMVLFFKEERMVTVDPVTNQLLLTSFDNRPIFHSLVSSIIKAIEADMICFVSEAWMAQATAEEAKRDDFKLPVSEREDKVESAIVKFETKDHHLMFSAEMIREGENVKLGEWKTLFDEGKDKATIGGQICDFFGTGNVLEGPGLPMTVSLSEKQKDSAKSEVKFDD